MNLVVVPFHDWNKCVLEGFRTRDAHLLEEFGRHPSIDKVLVVNRPLSPLEMIKKGIRRRNGEVRQVADKIYTVDTVIPHFWQPVTQRRNWIPIAYGHPRTVDSVQSAVNTLEIGDYALWSNSPIHVPLIELLRPPVLAFDMTDNLLKHADYRGMNDLSGYYDFCVSKADVVTANSPDNTLWLSEKRPDTLYISNGVSLERFDGNIARPVPPDIQALGRPIIGYAGKMQEMIDRDLLGDVSTSFPQLSFVFIGQELSKDWMQPLWAFPNVHYLGDKHYDQLPDYLAAFDICMIPYHAERQHGVDPIKFYEYMAMGKPIVTTDIGGVSRFSQSSQVSVAKTKAEFIDGLSNYVREIQQGIPVPTTSVPEDCRWSYKANQIIELIETKSNVKQSH